MKLKLKLRLKHKLPPQRTIPFKFNSMERSVCCVALALWRQYQIESICSAQIATVPPTGWLELSRKLCGQWLSPPLTRRSVAASAGSKRLGQIQGANLLQANDDSER